MMTLFLFSRNEILTFTMSFMWGSGCFFLSDAANNGENETGGAIVKVKSVAKSRLERCGFLT